MGRITRTNILFITLECINLLLDKSINDTFPTMGIQEDNHSRNTIVDCINILFIDL